MREGEGFILFSGTDDSPDFTFGALDFYCRPVSPEGCAASGEFKAPMPLFSILLPYGNKLRLASSVKRIGFSVVRGQFMPHQVYTVPDDQFAYLGRPPIEQSIFFAFTIVYKIK